MTVALEDLGIIKIVQEGFETCVEEFVCCKGQRIVFQLVRSWAWYGLRQGGGYNPTIGGMKS